MCVKMMSAVAELLDIYYNVASGFYGGWCFQNNTFFFFAELELAPITQHHNNYHFDNGSLFRLNLSGTAAGAGGDCNARSRHITLA